MITVRTIAEKRSGTLLDQREGKLLRLSEAMETEEGSRPLIQIWVTAGGV